MTYPVLYLIRHGFTDANRDEIVAGAGFESNLLPEGYEQSRQAGIFLRDKGIKRIFCSPQGRTRKTLEALYLPGIPVEFDGRLREIHCGIYEGVPFKEMGETFSVRNLAKHPDLAHPGGESAGMLRTRLRAFIDEKLPESPSPTLIVLHGGSGTAFILEFLQSFDLLNEPIRPRGIFGNSEVIKLEKGKMERVFEPTLKSE
jgi:broad specificity phosphatase PhoE